MARDIFKQYQVSFKEGERVFEEGDLGTEMYIIQSGSVSVEKMLGDKTHRLAKFEKGDFFGEMSLLENEPRSATVVCLEDCEMVKINSAVFDEMIRGNIEIAVRMLRKFSHRLREADLKIEKLMESDLSGEARKIVEQVEAEEKAPKKEDGEKLAVMISAADGREFAVTGTDILLGRADPVTGINPDIDLSSEENARSVSRRHARLLYQDETFYLSEEIGALNGTFVDGKRLKPGIPVPLSEGSEVMLGMVALRFKNLQ